jgi:tetratricopeptide (TPR) repeat protein
VQSLTGAPPKALKRLDLSLLNGARRRAAWPRKILFLGTVVQTNRAGDAALSQPEPIGAMPPSTPVVLRWKAARRRPTALRLHLRAFDADADLLQRDLSAGTLAFAVPANLLSTGVWYRWSVATVGAEDGEEEIGALVYLLRPEEVAQIEAAERSADQARQDAPDDPDPDLLLAETYASYGMIQAAIDAYRRALPLRSDPAAVGMALKRLQHAAGKP